MMRLLGLIGIGMLLLSSCGARKRAHTAHRASQPAAEAPAVTPVLMPAGEKLPEDTGAFVYYPIATVEEYIATFAPVAKREMQAYGIPASITLAQGILESGYGRGELTRKTNNHFGIKCHTGWEGAYEAHDDDEKGECFRKYNHPMYSFRDHSIFLSSRSRYAPLFDLRQDDYRGWARGLKAAGYATDRQYPQKLISFIERYDLSRFDREVLGSAPAVAVVRHAEPEEYGIHVVQQGDTLYSLSRHYETTVPELMKLNNMTSSKLAIGQQLRVQTPASKR